MGIPPLNSGTITVWCVYLMLVLVIVLAGRGRRGHYLTIGSPLAIALLLPLCVVLGRELGALTERDVFWLCNCSSYAGEDSNNHFNEDIGLAHIITVISLLWLGLSAEVHRALGWDDWPLVPVAMIGGGFSLFCWVTVRGPSLGCGC